MPAEHPDAVAVVAGDERITYAELDARSRLLAGQTRGGRGSHRGCVALVLPRSVDLIVAMIAVVRRRVPPTCRSTAPSLAIASTC
ncbi:AMP-binding protein [Rhodococcus hoagii]|nr:AMP-binding protein [Prescottella equi]